MPGLPSSDSEDHTRASGSCALGYSLELVWAQAVGLIACAIYRKMNAPESWKTLCLQPHLVDMLLFELSSQVSHVAFWGIY
jgi:hypothetical protein